MAEPKADKIRTDTTNFNNNLSVTDIDAQKALDTINDLELVETETDPLSLHLDQTTPQEIVNGKPRYMVGGTITRDVDGYIETVAYTGGRTFTISRVVGYINSITDGVRTWTYSRDGDNKITSWSVS